MDVLSFFGFRPISAHKSKKNFSLSQTRSLTSKPSLELLENRLLPSCNTISGFVFRDANANGLFDSGETPIANSALELRNAAGQVVGTTITDASGHYEFTYDSTVNTTPITTEQIVTIPTTLAGFNINKQINQFNPALGELMEVEIIHNGSITSDIRAENNSTLVGANITGVVSGKMTLSGPGFTLESTVSENAGSFIATAFDGTVDFGGTSGKAFAPSTANAQTKSTKLTGSQLAAFIGTGQLNFTENVEVNSTATGGGNLLVGINSSANATFTVRYKYRPENCLDAGDYTIIQKEQPPLPNSTDRYLDGKESKNGVVVPNSVGTDQIHVTLGNTNLPNNNFAEIAPACLSGNVYFDQNNNGARDSGETGIPGVTVNLTGIDDQGQTVTRTLTTGADGTYTFAGLRPGTYTINEQQPSAYLDGKDTIGSVGGVVSNDQFANINLTAGAKGSNYNFGEIRAASLAGFVYSDGNNNGNKETGEAGIAGVTVTLTGFDDQGAVSRTTQSGSDGSYRFDNLRAGTYTITETQPSRYTDGKDTVGSSGGTAGNDVFSGIELGNGVQGVNYNFGEINPTGLSGFVYHDQDNDGVKDPGEKAIAGVRIRLVGSTTAGPVIQETTTGTDGSYEFSNLVAGTYEIQEDQPQNYLDGKDTIGTPGGTTGNDHFTNIVLTEGTIGTNNNFGELCPSSLSGFVYEDTNDNGLMDIGEDPIPGVTVKLDGRNSTGAFTQTTTTGADGSYSFEGLAPGTYELSETQPAGFGDGKDTVGTHGGTMANDHFTGINLASGQDANDYNFGERVVTDVKLDKEVSATTIPAGATFTYTLTVSNLGSAEAEDLQVLDTLPDGVTFDSATAVGWNVENQGNHLVFTRSNLAVGASSTITITAIAPPREGTYLNRAEVTTSTLDINPNNNIGTAAFDVPAPPTQGVDPPPDTHTCLVILFSYDQWWLT